jgi:hypothetical protein
MIKRFRPLKGRLSVTLAEGNLVNTKYLMISLFLKLHTTYEQA